MTGWRNILLLLLSLLLSAGSSSVALVVPLLPLTMSNEEEESSSLTEVALALDVGQHARRAVDRHRSSERQHIVHPPRRHHAPAVLPLTPPAPFRSAANAPLHC
jgi:hypothetical protein